jgi:adenylate cyclase
MELSAKLLISSAVSDEAFECAVDKPEIRIGRSALTKTGMVNDIVLSDNQVSREHAIIRRQGNEFAIIDLESANGSFINGQRISGEHRLTMKDSLQIGKYILKLDIDTFTLPQMGGAPKGNTILLRAPNSASILMQKADESQAPTTSEAMRTELEQLRKKAEVLSTLYELNSVFNSVFKIDEIFVKLAEMLFRLTPAERCLVQVKDQDTGELTTRLVKFRSERHNKEEMIKPPRAIVEQVMREQVTLLSLDAQADERISGKTVMLQQVQSVICAPLMVGGKPLGVLYIDNKSQVSFSPDDLDLLNAIAVQTSMALDNATAHDRLMHEALAREAFGRFLPDHIVNEIMASPDSLNLGGTNKLATIMFADVRGFTPLSEKLRPEEVVELLNEYFTNMTDIIFSHQGLLDKYIGDGLMALFGVAYAPDEAPANAVKAAMDMQRRMVGLREKFMERFDSQVSIGIGINTGIITVGYIGSVRRMEYTGIGDSVNLAARLESNTKPSQILVSSTTHQLLKGEFPTRPLGKIMVKGKSEPQEVFEVLWQEEAQV